MLYYVNIKRMILGKGTPINHVCVCLQTYIYIVCVLVYLCMERTVVLHGDDLVKKISLLKVMKKR